MGEASLCTEYNNMSVTSYEFLIITEFPKKEIRAEPSRAGRRRERGASVCLSRETESETMNRKKNRIPPPSPPLFGSNYRM